MIMDKTIKQFVIPRCIDSSPEVFGLSIPVAVTSLGLVLLSLIMLAKSIIFSLIILVIMYLNLKLSKKFKKVGGLFSYLSLLFEKKENVRTNCSIESLIQTNKTENGR